MHGFLKHEFWKSRNRFLILTACLAVLFCCYFLYTGHYLSTVNFPENQRTAYAAKAGQLKDDADRYLQGNDVAPDDAKKVAADLDTQEKLLEDMADSNRKGDWKAELRGAVEQMKLEQSMVSGGIVTENPYLPQKLVQDRYFLDHGIRPKDSDSACDGLNVLVMIARRFLPVLTPLCVLLLSLGAWLSEKKSGSMKLLLWQARPKRKILFDKLIAVWVESTAAIAVSCLAAFLVCRAFFGLGMTEYPVFLSGGLIRVTGEFLARTAAVVPAATFALAAVCSLIAGGAVLKSESV